MKNRVNTICNKINNEINKYKNNNILFVILFLIVLLTSFKVLFLDVLAVILLFIVVLFLKPEEVLYSYIFLFFFEQVSEISFLGGTINRIVLGLGILKVLYHTYKEKIAIKKVNLIITLFFSFFLVYSIVLDENNIVDNVALYINFMFFVLYANYLSYYELSDKKRIINILLRAIVCGVFCSIIHGLASLNFDLEKRLGFTSWRFNGTADPNFLAYYINLAMIVQLFRKKSKLRYENIINIVINVFLLIGLLLTKSITGITINIISFIVLVIIKNKESLQAYIHKSKGQAILICSLFLVFLGMGIFLLIKNNTNEVYVDEYGRIVAKNRIADVILSIKRRDVNRLTSQKTRDWQLFFEDYEEGNVITKLFGKGMDTYLVYSSYWGRKVASHSAYIDFLCCYGIVGMIVILYYIRRKLKEDIVLLSFIDSKVYRYIRIILLVYALELNIYTNRVFLLMFLL